jgi:starvation-inducible DNA-binding protein
MENNMQHTQTVRDINASTALLDGENRVAVVTALSEFLASTYILYHKTLFYHWNVTGPHFASLHKLFEDQYEELAKAGDRIAERIRALGYYSPGTVAEFLSLSALQEDHTMPENARKMASNLMRGHETCSIEAGRVLACASKSKDQATMDLMINRIAEHDKAGWMLRSFLA